MGNTAAISCQLNSTRQSQDYLGSLQEKVETPVGLIVSTPNGKQKFFIKEYCFATQQDSQNFKNQLSCYNQASSQNQKQDEQESHLMPLVKVVESQLNNYCSITYKLRSVYEYHSYSLYDQLVGRAKAFFEKIQKNRCSSVKHYQNISDYEPQFSASFGSQETRDRKQTQNNMKSVNSPEKCQEMIKLFNQEEIWCILSGCIIGVCQLIRKDGYHHNELSLRDIKISRQGLVLLLRNQMVGCQDWHQISELRQANENLDDRDQNCEYGLAKLAKTILSMMLSDPKLIQEKNDVSKLELQQALMGIDELAYSLPLKRFIAKMLDPTSEFIYLEDSLLKILDQYEPLLRNQNISSQSINQAEFARKAINRVSTRRLLIHNEQSQSLFQINNQKTKNYDNLPVKDKFSSLLVFSQSNQKEKTVEGQSSIKTLINATYSTKNMSVKHSKKDLIQSTLVSTIPLTQQKINDIIACKDSNHTRKNSNKDGMLNITLKKGNNRNNLKQKQSPMIIISKKVEKQNKVSSFG